MTRRDRMYSTDSVEVESVPWRVTWSAAATETLLSRRLTDTDAVISKEKAVTATEMRWTLYRNPWSLRATVVLRGSWL